MTYLTAVQDFCAKWGMPIPGAVVSSTDATVRQLHALVKEAVEDLGGFPPVRKRITWSSVATESQGDVDTVFGTGFETLVPGTFWDVTGQRQILGPMSDQRWQELKSSAATGPSYFFKILADELLVWPVPDAGRTFSAIVETDLLVIGSDGSAKSAPTADDDTFVFGTKLLKAELEWRWLKQKGEPFEDSRQRARDIIVEELSRKGNLPELNFGDESRVPRPGIFIPAGSWSL